MWHTSHHRRPLLSSALRGIALGSALWLGSSLAAAQERPALPATYSAAPTFTVPGSIALHSLVSLSDAHLQKLADVLAMLAGTDAVRSGEWERMRAPLVEAARVNVPAALWFALPNGTYWTLAQGRAPASLSDRSYFARALRGRTVVGDLVVSRSTARNVAIVAVPVRGREGVVSGVLGASVHLDSLAALLRQEMGGLDDELLFFAIDSQPLGALNSDSALIFTEPMRLGDAGMRRAFTEILAGERGVVTYDFRGSHRAVLYRKSPVTGWWYGFGMKEPRTAAAPAERVVTLGGLFSLTGNWSTRGLTSKAAMELAIADVNQYLAGNAADLRFAASIEDTRLEPGVALEQARALHAGGVQLLIGPQSSAEVARLKPFVDANAMLLVSPASTAGTLAIADDNVFRFTPADSLEGIAISAMMWADGIREVVPVWRDDPGNAGLEKATRAGFTNVGGTVSEGVAYGAHTADFAETVASLVARVRQAVARHGAAQVAVYLAGFDEVVGLFTSASADPVLRSVRWYGSDGVANSAALLRDPRAAAFAVGVGYPTPLFAVEEGARDIWAPLSDRIRARTGHEPDAYALTVYDAVWVIARGYVASGATRDVEKLKHAFTTAASTHYGATGWTVLNAAGDRRYGDYAFWTVRIDDGTPRWAKVANYETRTGRLVRLPALAQTSSAETVVRPH